MRRIRLQALVADEEAPALESAARRLSETLGAAAGEPYVVSLERVTSSAEFAPAGTDILIVVSLLGEALDPSRPWEAVEADLWTFCRAVATGRTLYLLTVFRHVAAEGDAEAARARRTRIRRLDLLAAELSRVTGLYVIDLDRALADVGAHALQTDYRLAGPHAAEAAALTIADTVLAMGLDAFAPFEVQEAARGRLAPLAPPAVEMEINTLAVRAGGRTQTASVLSRKENQLALYARQVLSRRMRMRDALSLLSREIARRGLWYCVALIARESLRAARRRAATAGQPGR